MAAKTVSGGEPVEMPSEPTREGYIFKGWYIDEEYSDEYNFELPVTTDITLYAMWEMIENGCVVTFNSMGGSDVKSRIVVSGETVEKPADPAKGGYTFKGWFIDEECLTEFNFLTKIKTDITLYAKWEEVENGCIVTFNSMGGSEVQTQTIVSGETVERPADPTRDGYIFKGWFIDEECLTEFNFLTTIKADTTLYAKWEKVTSGYVVTFDSRGGTPVPSQIVEPGGLVTEPADPLKDEYSFAGWQYDESAPKTYDFRTPVQSDLTLFANWTARIPDTVFVVFDTLGGTHIATRMIRKGNGTPKPADPEKEGFTFIGWFLDKEYTTPFSFTESITEDTVVYAKWEERPENTARVTFRILGKNEFYRYVEFGKTVDCPEDPTREGYIFAGWLYEEKLYSFFDFDTPITEDITLYAQWEPEPVVPLMLNNEPCANFKALTDKIKKSGLDFFWIVVSEDYKENKAITFPAGNYEAYIVGRSFTLANPTITVNGDVKILCDLNSAKSGKPVTIKVGKNSKVTIKRTDSSKPLAFSGTPTSSLVLETDITAASITKMGSISTHGRTLTVTGKMTGVEKFDGTLICGTQTDIKNIGTASISLNPANAKKTVISGVSGQLTVTAGDGSAIRSGEQLFTYKSSTAPDCSNITVANKNSDDESKPLTAYWYKSGNIVKAEYGGAVTLPDKDGKPIGSKDGKYPNLDLAFAAVNNTDTEYVLTLEQNNVPFTKFTFPTKAKSLTIRSGLGEQAVLDLGKTTAITSKFPLTIENVKVTGSKSPAIKTSKSDLTLIDSQVGAVTTTGTLTVNGTVTANGAVSCAKLNSTVEGSHITVQSLAVTKSGIDDSAKPITLKLIDKNGNTVKLTAGGKNNVAVKTFKMDKNATYKEGSLILDEDCGTGKLTFSQNKLILS